MPASPPNPPDTNSAADGFSPMDIDQWLENLRRADRSFYNLMALEVWSIAKTMDRLLPGFWSRFMSNRQVALKQFVQQKRASSGAAEATAPPPVQDNSQVNEAD